MAHQLLEWYYLIFELPLALGLLYLGLYTFSGWTFGDAEADASGIDHDVDAHLDAHGEVTLEHDADLSHDVSLDADADVDADVDADTDTDSDSPQQHANAPGPSPILTVLSWIGVGRMPISLVLMVLLICWGTIGFACMQLLGERRLDFAIAIAAVGSVFISRGIASVLSKTVFAQLNVARRRHELLGSFGEALYDINDKFGMACGRDDRGELFQVPCRIEEGQTPIAKGSSVQLVAYTANDQVFTVVPAETSRTPRQAASV
jgi:hypothetical protein